MLGFDEYHFCYYYNSNAWLLALAKFNDIPFFYIESILPEKDQGIITLIKHNRRKNYPLWTWHQAHNGG